MKICENCYLEKWTPSPRLHGVSGRANGGSMLMNQETIKRFIEEAHGNAVERGFYDCTSKGCCYGNVLLNVSNKSPAFDEWGKCETCNGTGLDSNKNIGELLMLIVSELVKALEAHRCGRFAEKSQLVIISDYAESHDKEAATVQFERFIKDTFEDKIADVFIRLFDLCGYVSLYIHDGINDESGMIREYMSKENVGECLLSVVKQVCGKQIITSIMMLMSFCRQRNIQIQKHIEAKMAYNRTRPHKNGKEY